MNIGPTMKKREEKDYIKAMNYSCNLLLDEETEKQKYLYSYLDLD